MTPMPTRLRALGLLATSGLLLAGCGGPTNQALEEARARVQAAESDPDITAHAPFALQEAEAALARAETARRAGESAEEVAHLAYLASQSATIAEYQAAEKQASERIASLGEQRKDVQLEQAEARAAELERRLAELEAEKTDRGYVMTLGDILFDVDRAELTAGGMQEVARLASFLQEFPDRNVVIEGHTDSTGEDSYNQQLSERRALAVQDALIAQGIEPFRIAARGYGERYPEVSNETSAGRQQNRRVEIVILDEGERPVPRA